MKSTDGQVSLLRRERQKGAQEYSHIENAVDELGTLGVMTLGPCKVSSSQNKPSAVWKLKLRSRTIVTSTGLTEDLGTTQDMENSHQQTIRHALSPIAYYARSCRV
jgi:hypothetical protein